MPATALKRTEQIDEKQELLARLGDLSHVRIAQNEVLLAIYVRPEKTPGGIILTQKNRKEDMYQGKVGLVVKIGEACQFVRGDPEKGRQYGIPVKLHDWVVVRPSDTWPIDVNTDPNALQIEDFVPCRLVFDDRIRLVVSSPGVIW